MMVGQMVASMVGMKGMMLVGKKEKLMDAQMVVH